MANQQRTDRTVASIFIEDDKMFCLLTFVYIVAIFYQLPDDFIEVRLVSETFEHFLPYGAAILLSTRLAYNTRKEKVFAVYRAFQLGIPIIILWTALAGLAYYVSTKKPIDLTLEYTPYWLGVFLSFVAIFIIIRWFPYLFRTWRRKQEHPYDSLDTWPTWRRNCMFLLVSCFFSIFALISSALLAYYLTTTQVSTCAIGT